MVSDYTRYEHNGLTVEVNWNKDVTPCKFIRFTIAGKEVVVNREDFYSMMVLFSNEEQMTDLIPVIETKMRAITRMLKVRAKKDLRKGETMAFPYTYYIPAAVYERLLLSNPKEYAPADQLSPTGLEAVVNKKK